VDLLQRAKPKGLGIGVQLLLGQCGVLSDGGEPTRGPRPWSMGVAHVPSTGVPLSYLRRRRSPPRPPMSAAVATFLPALATAWLQRAQSWFLQPSPARARPLQYPPISQLRHFTPGRSQRSQTKVPRRHRANSPPPERRAADGGASTLGAEPSEPLDGDAGPPAKGR
jgi:hypothetical protein